MISTEHRRLPVRFFEGLEMTHLELQAISRELGPELAWALADAFEEDGDWTEAELADLLGRGEDDEDF